MNWDINWVAGLVAGVVAMVPGAVIYSPGVLGKAWMREIDTSPEKMKASGARSPAQAMSMMLVASLVNGLFVSLLANSAGAKNVGDGVLVGLVVGWFWVSASLMLVFFENRSWKWFKISALSHILTAVVLGFVVGLFL